MDCEPSLADEATAFEILSRRLDRIAAMPDSQAKTDAIKVTAKGLERLSGRANKIRGDVAQWLFQTQTLSLKELADKVGISKARAQQIKPKETSHVRHDDGTG